MNTSTIMDLIRNDPTIAGDPQIFMDQWNAKDISQIIKVEKIVNEIIIQTSFAEQNGGICTQKDIDDAIELLRQEPLKAEAQKLFSVVQDAIDTGDIKTTADLKQAFASASANGV